MNIQAVLKTINQMQVDGVIGRYAIGGAVGATFYLEPVATLDVDVFVGMVSRPGELPLSLQPIFDYLKAHGATMEGEYIVVAGWPVRLLPAGNPLIAEALDRAVGREVAGIVARVSTAEHLAAIALQTGRAKDKARLLQFLEAGALDLPGFEAVLARHNLTDWVTDIRDQCLKLGVAFHFKQWGGVFKQRNGRKLEGRTWDDMPNAPIPAARPAQLDLVPA